MGFRSEGDSTKSPKGEQVGEWTEARLAKPLSSSHPAVARRPRAGRPDGLRNRLQSSSLRQTNQTLSKKLTGTVFYHKDNCSLLSEQEIKRERCKNRGGTRRKRPGGQGKTSDAWGEAGNTGAAGQDEETVAPGWGGAEGGIGGVLGTTSRDRCATGGTTEDAEGAEGAVAGAGSLAESWHRTTVGMGGWSVAAAAARRSMTGQRRGGGSRGCRRACSASAEVPTLTSAFWVAVEATRGYR